VSLFSNSGAPGSIVGILGEGLTGTTNVSFNVTSATFAVTSDTYLTATVPSGAKTGFVTIKTEHDTLRSNFQEKEVHSHQIAGDQSKFIGAPRQIARQAHADPWSTFDVRKVAL